MWTILLGVTLAGVGLVKYGQHHWSAKTRSLYERLEETRVPAVTGAVDFRELNRLPPPVQRYFRKVLQDGQPMVESVGIWHQGTFNMGEESDQWKPFSSDQKVLTRRPGFVWNARVEMMPGIPVYVHDAYVAGEGILQGAVLGLIDVVSRRGEGEIAKGELMRFFAEAAWYPTRLLPGQGLAWEAVDDSSAKATMADGSSKITMLFTFNEEGLIDTVRAERRGRTVGGKIIPTPWEGRFWNYRKQQGMLVPFEGEVSWLLPEGKKPYWRGNITQLAYQFPKAPSS